MVEQNVKRVSAQIVLLTYKETEGLELKYIEKKLKELFYQQLKTFSISKKDRVLELKEGIECSVFYLKTTYKSFIRTSPDQPSVLETINHLISKNGLNLEKLPIKKEELENVPKQALSYKERVDFVSDLANIDVVELFEKINDQLKVVYENDQDMFNYYMKLFNFQEFRDKLFSLTPKEIEEKKHLEFISGLRIMDTTLGIMKFPPD